MSTSDDEFFPSDTDATPRIDSNESSEEDEQEEPPGPARRQTRAIAHPPKKARATLPTDLQGISHRLSNIKKRLNGLDFDENLSLRVVAMALELQKLHLSKKRKLAADKRGNIRPANIRNQVCQLMHISTRSYGAIMQKYLADGSLYVSGKESSSRSGNSDAKDTRIPRTHGLQVAVRDWLREKRANKTRVTARQLLDFFVEQKYLVVPLTAGEGEGIHLYESKPLKVALRNVQRWIVWAGFRRGKRNNIQPNAAHVLRRHAFLREFFANRALPPGERLREVYLDESYIHQYYNRMDDSIWDPNDDQDIQFGKDKHKGKRYCFLCAIQGPNPASRDDTLPSNKAGLVPGSIFMFCPNSTKDHKGDYHKVFNGDNFLRWWSEQLLPNLQEPSIIILDNAPYHLVYGDDVPKINKMKKQECIDYLLSKNQFVDPSMSAVELKAQVRRFIKEMVPVEVVKRAQEGPVKHKVLFSPPHHSDFQPIELTWARVKGNIGRLYTTDTTLDDVHQRLRKELNDLLTAHDSINGMIEKCVSIMTKFHNEIPLDEVDDEEGDADNASASSGAEESVDEE
jgi:hypothetical protein